MVIAVNCLSPRLLQEILRDLCLDVDPGAVAELPRTDHRDKHEEPGDGPMLHTAGFSARIE